MSLANPKDQLARSMGRVPIGLFPDTAIIAGSYGMLEGKLKYGRCNYRMVGIDASVYRDALDRHLKAWWNGEDLDPDSGIPHLWKMMACLAVLIDGECCGKLNDDRPPRAPVAEMLEAGKALVKMIEAKYADTPTPRHYSIQDTPCLPSP